MYEQGRRVSWVREGSQAPLATYKVISWCTRQDHMEWHAPFNFLFHPSDYPSGESLGMGMVFL